MVHCLVEGVLAEGRIVPGDTKGLFQFPHLRVLFVILYQLQEDPGVLSRIRISWFTSSVKAETMCSRTERFPVFGFPYRNTLLVTVFWKDVSFLCLAFGIMDPPFWFL